ncbi:polymorphic toxin-type HINT domain-containing protein [Streptomyces sp. JV176]|uniref:polymorphic toxin-type HINT domain-containing protein n=1 Tax=Streptomyces sp. JV176 TaxID=858630 RepID=UPI002E79E47F|nr:polymorphic toxin-type HINT domain-containing protein [Streptomyces sp. JV176]MEE1803852.1 polymorphic toxin-type HINT domain-containing protein [Streptomyces sp. JV176]
MPGLGLALLVALLPAQAALAIPPDPTRSGREELVLEKLDQDQAVSGRTVNRNLDSLKTETPADLQQAPSGTTTVPPADTGSVTFDSGAGARTASTATSVADVTPVADLPVSLGQAPGETAPTGTWQVTVAGRTETAAQGVDGAVVTVRPPATGAVPVAVRFDYEKFKNLYGADWASRLRFVQFPACYLDTPELEECQAYEELETVNDTADGTVTATVDTAGAAGTGTASDDGTATPASAPSVTRAGHPAQPAAASAAAGGAAVLGVTDSGAGAGGSFKATPLASSGTWAAGGSSGSFSWSYPLTVPPTPAGPSPNISFAYDSQEVDGKTAVSSPQTSWIGEGWDYEPGHIERRYRSCKDDTKKLKAGTPNNTAKKDQTSDLCWVSHNAVMSLNGRTTELVREGDTNTYRPQNDDGTRVELKTGAANGAYDGEYWVVTTPDGTTYHYGLNAVGGGHAVTNSVSTVPVYGNHPGEPCYAATFAGSRCGAGKQQAWQWGMDKVVDVHGNAMVVNWKQETNHYSVNKKFKSPERYDRAAYPVSIEYGMRTADLTKPSATVEFGVQQRCLKSTTACDPANFAKTDDPGAYRPWWDTPGNLNCKSTSKLCPAFPSFWTQLRLDTVTTKAARAGRSGLGKVDTYTLHQSFPEDWYDTSPSLWLNSITRRGFAPGDTTGTLQSKDGVSFGEYRVGSSSPLRARLRDRQLPNLVPSGPGDQRPAFTRPRIGTVATENGGDIQVEYTGGCATEPATDKGKANTTCYPVRWSPDGEEKTPAKAWFNKYVVASVTETDRVTTHGKPVVTAYKYTSPAWQKTDNEFLRPALRTYSTWRGYRQVAVTKGSKSTSQQGDPQSQSHTVTRFFQGTGGQVKDSKDAVVLLADDAPQFAGMTAETLTYKHSEDPEALTRALTFPKSKETASRPRQAEDGTDLDPLLAHRTWVARTDAVQKVGTSWRAVRTETTVDDTYGLPTQLEMSVVKPNGTGETVSDQVCMRTSYVHNRTDWIIGKAKETRSTATPCTGFDAADTATELLGSVRTSFDGQAWGTAPVKGLETSVSEINGSGSAHAVTSTTSYDPLGRVRKSSTPLTGTSETVYTPGDSGGPVTAVKLINAKGHASTTVYDPGRALALTATDPNGRVTRTEYDALGRLVKGWSPGRSSGGKSPDTEISYRGAVATSSETRPAAVTVKSLKDDGRYASEVTLYDGLGRTVQTQSEAHGAGRIITDTKYNDHGLVWEQTGGYLAQGEPETRLFARVSESLVPNKTKTRYDGLERAVRSSVYHGADFKYATYTTYGDDYVYVDPPGQTAPSTQSFTDAQGRVTSVQHYTKAGGTSTRRTTNYTYDARGNHTKVTDPAGNAWEYAYDVRGRLTSSTDPDTGTSTFAYDDADRRTRATDVLGKSIHTQYDELDRVVAVREGSATSAPVKEFTYDTLPGATGLPVASIRHDATGDYIDRVTGYDTDYQPTGRETVIPSHAVTAGLSGTYTYSYAYTPTGKPLSVTLPAKGGLAAEKVVTRYDDDGLPESTSGISWYTSDITYSPYGEPLRSVSGSQPARVWTTNFVDQHTGSLQRTVTDRETAGTHRVADSYYSYDASGTITSNARKLTDASGSTWDNQCYTYDALGELVHAWTSTLTPGTSGTGCRSSGGTNWGYRADGEPSGGPVADAPTVAADTTTPSAGLTTSLAAAAPAATSVSTGATAYRQSFTYDWLGNRATLTDHDPADAASSVTYTSRYGRQVTGKGLVQPHTLTSVAATAGGKSSAYTYDDVGNTTVRDLPSTTQNLAWTAENKLDTITDDGVKTRYVYDAAGNRILENSPTGSTLYLGETELTTDNTGKITRASRAYSHPGAPTVVRTATNGSGTGHTLSALISDHLGTANTTVELGASQTVTRRAFKPYGEARGPKPALWPNKRSYLGTGIDDAATGLTHLGAREYDQAAGRFLSADPVIDVTEPLQMNGYAYAGNSPVSSSDPTGLCPADICGHGKQNPSPHYGGGPPEKSGGGGGGGGGKSNAGSGSSGTTATVTYTITKTVTVTKPAPCDFICKAKGFWKKYKTEIITITTEVVVGVACGSVAVGAGVVTAGVGAVAVGASCGAIAGGVAGAVSNAVDSKADKSLGGFAKSIGKGAVVGGVTGAAGAAIGKAIAKGVKAVASKVIKRGSGAGGPKGSGGGAKSSGGGLKPGCPTRNSFLPKTEVLLADGTRKKIADVKVGDRVLATDPKTGETVAKPVTAEIIGKGVKNLVRVTIDLDGKKGDRTASVTATDKHPFWVPELDEWINARDLHPGQWLRTSSGTHIQITAIKTWTQPATVHNLTVADIHTYYVLAGATPVLVHNCNVTLTPKEANTLRVGPHADGEAPVAATGPVVTSGQSAAMQGRVCHSCGETSPTMTGDHQPSSGIGPVSLPRSLFPHCETCSDLQSVAVGKAQQILREHGYHDPTFPGGFGFPSAAEKLAELLPGHTRG